ncbi:MAG: hypothetical protein IJU65_03020 [Desulfovibrio sp.]|nr:hypothetical protein [Desulfovibrio sp.]
MRKFCKSIALLAMVFCSVVFMSSPSIGMGGKPDTAAKQESTAEKAENGTSKDAAKETAASETSTKQESSTVSEENKISVGDSIKSVFEDKSAATADGGTIGNTLASMLGESSGTSSPGLDGMMHIPGVGMPPMSIGGLEEALFPVGGMAAPSSMDGFPPFFGDNGAQQPPAQQGVPNPSIVGTWSAPNGQQTLTMVFQPGGACTIIDKGQQVNGFYEVRGNQLVLRFANGKSFTLNFSIQGDFLVFSDGSRLQRQSGVPQQPMPAQAPMPQQQPMPQAQNVTQQGLEGAWAVSDGKTTIIMMFMNGVCGFNVNGRQFYGPYTVQGNRLHVQFTNAQPLDVTFTVEGNALRFSDGTVLMRQQMPNMPVNNQPMPQQPSQQPGVWGQPQQPSQNPMPQQSSSASPLEGAWGTQLPNGATVEFIFKGNQYRVLTNGQQTETGIFTLKGNRLEYTTTSGQATGNKGVNTWQISGNVLILMMPDGSNIQFQRRPQ